MSELSEGSSGFGAAATVGAVESERDRTSGLTLSSMLVGWPSSWAAVSGRVSALLDGERVSRFDLQQVGWGGGVTGLDTGGVGWMEAGSIVASVMAGSDAMRSSSLLLTSATSSGVKSERILFGGGGCVGEVLPEDLLLLDEDRGGIGVVDLIGDGIEEGLGAFSGMTGILFLGSGRMFLLGRVYSVMSDCVKVGTRVSNVIFLWILFDLRGDFEEDAEPVLDSEADLDLDGLDIPDGPGAGSSNNVFGLAGEYLAPLPGGVEEVDADTGAKEPIGTGMACLERGKRTMLDALPVFRFPAWREELAEDWLDCVVDIEESQ